MEPTTFKLRPAKRKRHVVCTKEPPFPIPIESLTYQAASAFNWQYYTADLVGGKVIVRHSGDMDMLFKMGYFGTGMLSRNQPEYNHGFWGIRHHTKQEERPLRYVSKRRYLAHLQWEKSLKSEGKCTSEENFEYKLPLPTRKKTLKKLKTEPSTQDNTSLNEIVYDNKGLEGDTGQQGIYYAPWNSGKYEVKCDNNQSTVEEDPWANSPSKEETDAFWGDGDSDPKVQDSWSKAASKEETEAFWGDSDNTGAKGESAMSQVECKDKDGNVLVTGAMGDNSVSKVNVSEHSDVEIHDNRATMESACVDGKTGMDIQPHCSQTKDMNMDEPKTLISGHQSANHDNLANTPAESDAAKVTTVDCNASKTERKTDERCLESDINGDLYVVDDTEESDVEDEAAASRLKWTPCIKADPVPLHECLQLSLEEAFFLSYGLGCLVILDENKKPLNLVELWCKFKSLQPSFVKMYIAYHYLRSKGWVPKPGLKYGVQYLLYKEGPPFYHASYSVLVREATSDLREPNTDLNWQALAGVNRITETVNKEVLLCYVVPPSDPTDLDLETPTCIRHFTVQEVVLRRWISKHERDNTEFVIIP